MTALSSLLPVALAGLALLAACALARRGAGRPVELRWLDVGILSWALLALPPWALGWADRFTAPWVLGASLAASTLAFAIGVGRSGERLRGALRDLGVALTAPVWLGRWAARQRAWLTLAAVATVAFVWVYTTALSWLVPSSGWDSVWYHDTITAYTIQNQGFGLVELPRAHLLVNGYPRLSETVAAFFVVLSDDRLLEAAPTLSWPWLAVAAAALIANVAPWRRGQILGACVFALMPAMALQLRSSYVDVPPTFFGVAALAYVTRPRVEARDLWLAALAVAMLAAAKGTGLVFVPILGLVGILRVLASARRPGAVGRGLALAGGVLVIALIGGPTYLRNWSEHQNPIWPAEFESETLGIEWEGPAGETIANPEIGTWAGHVFGPRYEDLYHPDVRPHGYGHVLPWLFALWLLVWPVERLWAWSARRRWRVSAVALWLLAATLLLAKGIPPLWWGRFGAPVAAALLALMIGWLAGRRRLAAPFFALALAVHALTLYVAFPGWSATAEDLRLLAHRSPLERASFRGTRHFGDVPTLRAFEREVGEGDLVLWTDRNGFPAFAWNREMSNRAIYVPQYALRSQIEELRPKWVIVAQESGQTRTLERVGGYERVGYLTDALVGYRRVEP